MRDGNTGVGIAEEMRSAEDGLGGLRVSRCQLLLERLVGPAGAAHLLRHFARSSW